VSTEIEERLRASRPGPLAASRIEQHARRAALGALGGGSSRRRTVVGGIAVGATLAAVAAVLALLLIASPPITKDGQDPDAAAGPPPTFAVLDRPPGPLDVLPEWAAADRAVGPVSGIDLTTVRRAFDRDGRTFFVARGQARPPALASETVCLIDVVAKAPSATHRPGNPGGVSCAPISNFTGKFAVVRVGAPGRGVRGGLDYAGIVGDGFAVAAGGGNRAPVRGNAFLLRGLTPSTPITVSGSAGTRTLTAEWGRAARPDAFLESRIAAGRLDAQSVPTSFTFSGRLSPGYTTVSAAGRTTQVTDDKYVLADVPWTPFSTVTLVATGPRGSASYEHYFGPGVSRVVLRPYRSR
jgi:hypothetical protein